MEATITEVMPIMNAVTATANHEELTEDKLGVLKDILQKDLLGCDGKWTLFVAAAQSYRYHTELQPFPPFFITNETLPIEMNMNALITTINDTPRLHVLLQLLQDGKQAQLNPAVFNLTFWVLVLRAYPSLRPISREELSGTLQALGFQIPECQLPTQAFEVLSAHESPPETEFENMRRNSPTAYGFYGNQLDTFYALINQGFTKYFSGSNNFMGKVLTLSPTLEGCMRKGPPPAAAWGLSICGSIITCIGLCEYIDNPHFVQVKAWEDIVGSVHCENIEISNTDLVRLRYLFFYGNRTTDSKIAPDAVVAKKSWLQKNMKYVSLALSLALVTGGLAVTERGEYFREFCMRNIIRAVSFYRSAIKLNLFKFK